MQTKTSRKIISLAIAFVLVLALAPATVIGAADSVTVSFPQKVYELGQRVNVTVTGVTADMIANRCWIAIYDAGGGTSDYHGWEYVTTVGTSTIALNLPFQQGSFEIRFVPQYSASDGHSAVSQTISVVFELNESVGIGNYLWTGEWDTNWGKMTLTQNGRDVTGNYVYDQGIIEGKVYGNVLFGKWGEDPTYDPDYNDAGLILFCMSEDGKSFVGGWCYKYEYPSSWSSWSGDSQRLTEVMLVPIETPPTQQSSFIADEWAIPELEKALSYGLIPDVLIGADLTLPITRAEFAAVGVKLYENLTGGKLTVPSANPFTDTNDSEVLKAYSVGIVSGIVSGVGGTLRFEPDEYITREGMAHLLTNVLKVAYIPGCTVPNNYTLIFTMPALFSDDAMISGWAKNSVYFMAANTVIRGDNGKFMPRAVTEAEIAMDYALAAREHALIMALRITENLADKPLDYKVT